MRGILKQGKREKEKSRASLPPALCCHLSGLGLLGPSSPGAAATAPPGANSSGAVSALLHKRALRGTAGTGHSPWATLLTQSRYCSPLSSNMYWRRARTILMGSAAKKTLHEGLEIMKGNALVWKDCSVFFLLNEGQDLWKITVTKQKGKTQPR